MRLSKPKTSVFSIFATVAIFAQLGQARLFDSLVGYRHGTSGVNIDTSQYGHLEEPDAPESLDQLFGYTATSAEDGTINIVHCYSMRNGLYGSPKEARVLWSNVNPDPAAFQDAYHTGKAETIRVVSMHIESTIQQFDVHEQDLSAFLITQSPKTLDLSLHIVPGPQFSQRPMKSFLLRGLRQIEFIVSEFLFVTQAKRAYFYNANYLGEIDLMGYPFESETDVPSAKVYRVQGKKEAEGLNPDDSSRIKLVQVQADYVDEIFNGQIFLLTSGLADFSSQLRIDSIQASEPLGSSYNIARINTDAHSAYNAAKFTKVAHEIKVEKQKYFFATAAYQNYPEESIYISLSEATQVAGQWWSNDRSQAFYVPKEKFAETFIKPMAVRPHQEVFNGEFVEFSVYFMGPANLYRVEFTAQYDHGSHNWSLMKAELHSSQLLEMSAEVTKVFFQAPHLKAKNDRWPDFYFFMSSSRVGLLPEGKERTKDGLIYTEYNFRENETLKMMKQKVELAGDFKTNLRGSLPNLTYSDSKILTPNDPSQQAWNRTLMIDDQMMAQQDTGIRDRHFGYGTEWLENLEIVSTVIDYDKIVTTGISYKQLVSYMDSQESSEANILSNQIALANDTYALKLYNNLDRLVEDIYFGDCETDVTCAGTFSLGLYVQSMILECNRDKTASDRVFVPRDEQLLSNTTLVGKAWHWEVTTEEMPCYFATLRVKRLDGKDGLIYNSLLSKRIFVADPVEPPLVQEFPKQLYVKAGEQGEFQFGQAEDPEGYQVMMNFKLGIASKFAYWDPESRILTVSEGMTRLRQDEGDYLIKLQLIEIIDGVKMPPYEIPMNLTIGFFEPPTIVEKIPEPKNVPRVNIQNFLMNGKMTVTLSRSLNFPENVKNSMDIRILAGHSTDPSVLGFKFDITSQSDSQIDFQFKFDKPLEISQQAAAPERVNFTMYMGDFSDPDGNEIDGYASVISFVPRQIPSEAEAAAIEDSGSSSEAGSAGAGVTNFLVSLILAASLNQLWSMLNGLQLAVHMPLFKTAFPANANFFIMFIITVATFDLLPETVLPIFFDFPVKPSFNQAFQDTGYASMFPVMNLGTCFFLFNIYLMQLVIWIVCSCFKDSYQLANRWYEKYDKLLFWGGLIRLLFEGYLELCLSVFVGLTDMEWSGEMYNNSVAYCNFFAIFLTILLLGLPIFIFSWYTYYADKLEEDEFQEKFGDIYDGLVLDKDPEKRIKTMFYPFWFCMRRLLFSLVCILAQNDLWLQMSVAYVVGMVNLAYLIVQRPFDDEKVNNLEIMNEATNFILLYHVVLFSGVVPDSETRYLLGWSFIAINAMNMLVHFWLLIKETYYSIKEWCKKRKAKKEQGEVEEPPKKELSAIEELSCESNHTDRHPEDEKRAKQLSVSDWNSQEKGGSEKGFNLAKISWNDLGRKFIVKRGKKSIWPECDPRSELDSARRSRSLDDRFSDQRRPQEFFLSAEEMRLRKELAEGLKTPETQMDVKQQEKNQQLPPIVRRHSIAAVEQMKSMDSAMVIDDLSEDSAIKTNRILYQDKSDLMQVRCDMVKGFSLEEYKQSLPEPDESAREHLIPTQPNNKIQYHNPGLKIDLGRLQKFQNTSDLLK